MLAGSTEQKKEYLRYGRVSQESLGMTTDEPTISCAKESTSEAKLPKPDIVLEQIEADMATLEGFSPTQTF